MTSKSKKGGNKKWYLLLLLLLFGFIGITFSGTSIGITIQEKFGIREQVGHDSWSSMSTSFTSGVIGDIEEMVEDIGILLTLVPDSDYGHDYECVLDNMIVFGDCCDLCDPVADDCDIMCTPAMPLIMVDIPLPDDPIEPDEQIACYNECMSGTGCEFTQTREDIEVMCDTACLDHYFYGYDNEIECIVDCTDYYFVDGVDGTPEIALSCDYAMDMSLFGCRYESENESYVWDGETVTDVNAFFENGYPLFYGESKSQCLNWFRAGTWIDTAEKVGCVDFRFFADSGCTSESVESAKNVCEMIGGEFICVDADISCNI